MTVSDPLLLDQADRDRAITRTDRTLLVDAGAGSGKTHIMVERICRLVEQGVPIRRIAAVTFTESAASALRDRIRAQLARNADHGSARAATAVADLDAAAIGTLHAFARRILAEHPVQAQLPPIIEVLDDVASGVRVGRWWSSVRSALLDDPSMAQALGVLGALRVPVNARFQGVGLEGLALRMQTGTWSRTTWPMSRHHRFLTRISVCSPGTSATWKPWLRPALIPTINSASESLTSLSGDANWRARLTCRTKSNFGRPDPV